MTNFIKKATSVQEVGIIERSGITSVAQYTRLVHDKSSRDVIEKSLGDFEKNDYKYNAVYFSRDDNNPLLIGLTIMNKAALVIAGKAQCSTFAFEPRMLCSTPLYMKNIKLEEANIITLKNLKMYEPIVAGLKNNRKNAINFNTLAMNLTRDVQFGNPVYSKYKDEILAKGALAIREWISYGNN